MLISQLLVLDSVDTDGPFKGYKRPAFPYFIGEKFLFSTK
jgi:hypothetical protein